MNVFISQNRKALTGVASIFFLAGVLAFIAALANPAFVTAFSASASDVVTGQTSAVSVVVDSSSSEMGVFAEDN